MTTEIKKITDKKTLEDLYDQLFMKRDVYLKANELNIHIKFLKYEDNRVHLKIENDQYTFISSIIYIRNNEELIFSQVTPVSQNDNIFIFDTENIQIINAPRKEERKRIDSSKADQHVYISNIVSDFVINDCLSQENKKVDHIKWELSNKLDEKFTNTKVFFSNEKSSDLRMKYFSSNRKPFFIPDINDDSLFEKSDDNKFYKEVIYNKDLDLISENFISEISLPVLFKMMIPFGYIQVNSKSPLDDTEFSFLKKLGVSTSELLSKDNSLIKTSNDKLTITDLSMSGMGIVFKDRVLIKHFKDNSYIYFVIYMPDEKQASVLCLVRNINIIKNNIYRIGCEIENFDPIGEVNYSEFLEKVQ